MRISKKNQAIIDALQTQKEKDDYIEVLVREFKERDAKRNAKYRKENPEKVKERMAKYRKENPEKVKDIKARYQKANPEKFKEFRARCIAKKKAEKQLIESVIDGRKLAIELKQEKAYEWLINDNNGSYSKYKYELGIVLVNNLNFMSEEYNNAEYAKAKYGTYEAWTKENIDATCIMLDEMFEFCNKRQIKYINLN